MKGCMRVIFLLLGLFFFCFCLYVFDEHYFPLEARVGFPLLLFGQVKT